MVYASELMESLTMEVKEGKKKDGRKEGCLFVCLFLCDGKVGLVAFWTFKAF